MAQPDTSDTSTDAHPTDGITGIRPDLATVYCRNCGYEYNPKGNPCNVAPNAKVSANCGADDCNSGGTVIHNEYSYIIGGYDAVGVREIDEELDN